MKKLVLLFVTIASFSAHADSMREVSTSDLVCKGVQEGQSSNTMTMKITARKNVTKLEIKNSRGVSKELLNNSSLRVGSEGNVYIQQVSNELKYNLYLTGADLENVLYKPQPNGMKVLVTGTIGLFSEGATYKLSCSGTLY